MGQELIAVVDRVLGTIVQVQDPVHVLFMAEYIKALVTYHQEPISDVDWLDTLLEHVHILVISRHTHRVHHLQLLSLYNRLSFMHQCILSRVVLSFWARWVEV